MLLLASLALALAVPMAGSTLDAPAPVVADLDMLPEPGAWPCTVTMQVEGTGALGGVKVDSGCPSGLVDTARELAKGWTWEASAGPHTETAMLTFHVLRQDEPEPKPTSTVNKLVYVLRPMDVLAAPPTTASGSPGPLFLDKPPKVKLPKGAEALRLAAGTCTVRVDVGADGKVKQARANRCLDVLAPIAVAASRKVTFTFGEGNAETGEYDIPVRFPPAR